jgi:hypothetical protein
MHPATTHSLTAAITADRARDARRAAHAAAIAAAMPHVPDTDPPAGLRSFRALARFLAARRSTAGQW